VNGDQMSFIVISCLKIYIAYGSRILYSPLTQRRLNMSTTRKREMPKTKIGSVKTARLERSSTSTSSSRRFRKNWATSMKGPRR
jgi:hypothetical protein